MKISYHFTIVVISSFLWNGEHMKVAACDTNPPNNGYCGESLTVKKGRACYHGSHNTFASITCSTGYTFSPRNNFTCTYKTWKPSATAVCSSIAATTRTVATTIVLTMSSTSKLYPSDSSLFSTVQNSASFYSTSTSTALSTHKVLPSESNLVSTYLTVTSSETPFLTTYTTMSKTKMNTFSSDFQTKPSAEISSTSSLRQAVIKSSIITASSTMAIDSKVLDADNQGPLYVWYIVGAVVVCNVAIFFAVLAFCIIRRRRRMVTKQARDADTDHQVLEYTELDTTQLHSNPYSTLSKTQHRMVGNKNDPDNNDEMYSTPYTSTNPDVYHEYTNIDA